METNSVHGSVRHKDKLLDEMVARLKQELRARQQQLVEETEKNTRAKAQLHLLNSLALASSALQQLLTAQAAGDLHAPSTKPVLESLEHQMHSLVHAFDRGSNAPTPSSSSSAGSVAHSSTQQHAGLAAAFLGEGGAHADRLSSNGLGIGTEAAPFLRDIVAYCSVQPRSLEEFVAFWRRNVMELAMLLHHYKNGAAVAPQIQQVLYRVGVRFGALFLHDSWALEVMLLDLDTGVACEAQQGHWDRVAAGMQLSADQAIMFEMLDRWWRTSMSTLHGQREQLAQVALEATANAELQEAVASGLERVNLAYLVSVVASMIVGMLGLLRPEQVAESWVGSWPRMPLMTAILDALKRQKEAQ